MGILDGIVEWIAEQIMYGLDMINTSVLGALGCDMNTFLRYFPAAETMYSLLVALAIGLILLGWVWNLFKNYGLGLGVDAEDPVKLTAKAILFIVLAYYADEIVNIALTIGGTPYGITLEQMKQYFIKHQHAREIGDKKMMEKIEYHLTYINFHYECGLLATGQYDKLPEVIQNW